LGAGVLVSFKRSWLFTLAVVASATQLLVPRWLMWHSACLPFPFELTPCRAKAALGGAPGWSGLARPRRQQPISSSVRPCSPPRGLFGSSFTGARTRSGP
jgi:hypothetical protein